MHSSHKEGNQSPQSVAHNRRIKILNRRGYVSLLLRICVFTAAIWVVFSRIFLITLCNGQDMSPSMEDGDLILAYRLQQEYSKGDVILFRQDGQSAVGRIVALAGDYVALDESGNLVVNGTTQGGEILFPTYAKEGIGYPYKVPKDMVFVLGDHRTKAKDSRDFGPVPMENIEGKVITLIRRQGI